MRKFFELKVKKMKIRSETGGEEIGSWEISVLFSSSRNEEDDEFC